MQFVTEKEVEEIKERRQKEWEKARRPDQPLQRPEEDIDSRTLYEKLKVQRDKKQEEFEEQLKFKNMIYKGLDDDEAVFLQLVADKRAKLDAEMRDSERKELLAYRDAVEKLREETDITTNTITTAPSSSSSSSSGARGTSSLLTSSAPTKTHKSQLSLISSSIKTKRKRSSTDEVEASPEKKTKCDSTASCSSHQLPVSSSSSSLPHATSAAPSSSPSLPTPTGTSSALSGLTAYSSDSDDSSPN